MQAFINHCDLALAPVPDMEYYSCVGLCAFDAVFSIRSNYNSVVSPLVDRFCKLLSIKRSAPDPHKMPKEEEQIKISELQQKLKGYDAESLAKAIRNRQRTSSKSGILKTEAFLEYLEVFTKYKIETFQDVNRIAAINPQFEKDLKTIKGQNVAVDYFFMLAGDTDGVKVDTHLRRFANGAVGRNLTEDEIKDLFARAVAYYRQNGYPNMTARHLDHIVWTWQKSR